MSFKCPICKEVRSSKFRLISHLDKVERSRATYPIEFKEIDRIIAKLQGKSLDLSCNRCLERFTNQYIYDNHVKAATCQIKYPHDIIPIQPTSQPINQSLISTPKPKTTMKSPRSTLIQNTPKPTKSHSVYTATSLDNPLATPPEQYTDTPCSIKTKYIKRLPDRPKPPGPDFEIGKEEYLFLLVDILGGEDDACIFVVNSFHQEAQGDVAMLDKIFFDGINPAQFPIKCTDYINKILSFQTRDGEFLLDTHKGISSLINYIQNAYLMVQNAVIETKMNKGSLGIDELYTSHNMGAWQDGIYARGRSSNKEKFRNTLVKFLKHKEIEYKQKVSHQIEQQMAAQ